MKEQDRARFRANIQWFNQFFGGMRDIYAMVLDQLPVEFFPSITKFTSENYSFPRQKITPSIPSYYALLIEGYKCGLQLLTIVDENLIARDGLFIHEPSIIIVVHNKADKNSWVDEFALNVLGNRKVERIQKVDGIIRGHIKSKYPAEFFAFQVALDKFSGTDNPHEAVHQHIVIPLTANLQKGFSNPSS
jgi:hypothetical protein